MAATTIQWTDRSINPIRARNKQTGAIGHYCQKLSPGCARCYASNFQKRFHMPDFPGAGKYSTVLTPILSDNGAVSVSEDLEVFLDRSKFHEVLGRKKPTKFFWCDMTDMFGSWVPDAWIDECLAVMALTPQHTHQVLTKRADRLANYFAYPGRCTLIANATANIPAGDTPAMKRRAVTEFWPLSNIWLGVSVEDQKRADERIPHLLNTPATVRFLSVEPLLGPVYLSGAGFDGRYATNALTGAVPYRPDLAAREKIHWVIAGGESGPGSR